MTPTKDEIAGLKEALKKPVVLVGLMGSGKTRLGRNLAGALGLEFHDTDRIIEEKAGETINEIFANYGEEKFREVEKKTLLELLDKGPSIIASGGGAVINEGIPEALKEKALTVWLKADVKDLAQRIKHSQNRPLLKGKKPEDVLRDLAAKRDPFYARSDVTIEAVNMPPAEATSALIKSLYEFTK